jgi:hypothetical protein
MDDERGLHRLTVDFRFGMPAFLFLDAREQGLGRQGLSLRRADDDRVSPTAADGFGSSGAGSEAAWVVVVVSSSSSETERREEATRPRAGCDHDLVEFEHARRVVVVVLSRRDRDSVVITPFLCSLESLGCAVHDLEPFLLSLLGDGAGKLLRMDLGGGLLTAEDVGGSQQVLVEPIKEVRVVQFASASRLFGAAAAGGGEVCRDGEGVEFAVTPFLLSVEFLSELSMESVGQLGERSRCGSVPRGLGRSAS